MARIAKKEYYVEFDGMYSTVLKAKNPENHENLLTFEEAREALLVAMRNYRDDYAQAVNRALKLNQKTVEEGY